jgi:hypothetical protein
LAAAFCFAQRLRCASAIFFRDAALHLAAFANWGSGGRIFSSSLDSRARTFPVEQNSAFYPVRFKEPLTAKAVPLHLLGLSYLFFD